MVRIISISKIFYQFIDKAEKKLEYSDEFKAELDSRASYYYNGGKMVEPDELDKQVKEILFLSRSPK